MTTCWANNRAAADTLDEPNLVPRVSPGGTWNEVGTNEFSEAHSTHERNASTICQLTLEVGDCAVRFA